MTHLTDEQFEEVLSGQLPEPEHLAECELCTNRLAEHRALRGRLQSAFATVHAGAGLVEGIRAKARQGIGETAPKASTGRARVLHFARWAMPLSAAAIVLVTVSAFLLFGGTEPAEAGVAELYRIHQHALSPHTELFSDADPESLAAFLKTELGFAPAVPKLGAGMSLRGCCVTHFRDKPVGSYVVDTPRGVMSVIVVKETPRSLGMKTPVRRGDHTYMAGTFAMCNMVTVQLNGYTYCAVGEVSVEYLTDLLEQLVW